MSISFAPCNYCPRKPGFYSNGKNYCWIHWYKPSNNNIKMDNENLESYKKLVLSLKIKKEEKKYIDEYNKLILKIKNDKEDYSDEYNKLFQKIKKKNESKKIIPKSI